MVARRRLSVTLYVHCVPRLQFILVPVQYFSAAHCESQLYASQDARYRFLNNRRLNFLVCSSRSKIIGLYRNLTHIHILGIISPHLLPRLSTCLAGFQRYYIPTFIVVCCLVQDKM